MGPSCQNRAFAVLLVHGLIVALIHCDLDSVWFGIIVALTEQYPHQYLLSGHASPAFGCHFIPNMLGDEKMKHSSLSIWWCERARVEQELLTMLFFACLQIPMQFTYIGYQHLP